MAGTAAKTLKAEPRQRPPKVGALIAPRRAVGDGWIACDGRNVVLYRPGCEDVRIDVSRVGAVDLDGKNLTLHLQVAGRHTLHVHLTSFRASADLKLVRAIATAAGIDPA